MKARISWLLCIAMLMPGCIQRNKKQKPFPSDIPSAMFVDLSPDDIIRQQHDKNEVDATMHAITDRDAIAQYEAKLSDIPLPLHAESLSLNYKEQSGKRDAVTLEYCVHMPYDQLATFYDDEMERLGWRHVYTFGSTSYNAYFTKPDYACSLLIEPWKGVQKKITSFDFS